MDDDLSRAWGKRPEKGTYTMYAIAFDLDTAALAQEYPGNAYNNAYAEIRTFLTSRGFGWQQGSVYFGSEGVTPVTAVLAIRDFARTHPWFCTAVVRDIRMLRIEENNDLTPALVSAAYDRGVQGELPV